MEHKKQAPGSTPAYCSDLPLAHDHPTTTVHFYDNITLLLTCVKSLFSVIHDAEEGRSDTAEVAYLGEHLCEELERRAAALYEFQATPGRKED